VTADQPPWLTVEQTAAVLHLWMWDVHKLIAASELQARWSAPGPHLLVRGASVAALLRHSPPAA
jgi:hypothetical protein